ncbi:COP9 signalosome complex subunit 12 [Cordyceps militaris CM01]|uniref:Protein CSN12 homolog n=2 Tax=Cordyceps militaris TaxID=73501 RepID=G3J2P2_CORMM|nr:COP9 signalosome complex subunit 12 [Cordyceps militaris CM01]ATY61886.1 COP9 signalosome complex subunit 12 [Cordyceps militaris]EGX96376.1 COP9 signalosome complex subunit 12 [Cordyceps militaris CM01]
MNELLEEFAEAHAVRHGYILAQTLSPVPPPGQRNRLRQVSQSTNAHNIKGELKHFIKTKTARKVKLDHDEVNGWVDVYAAYWKAVGEIVAGEEGRSTWTKVYEAWKELTSMLIRGYNSHGFEAWTIPTLYMVGKYLRLFAIKSDAERSKQSEVMPTGSAALMQDDFDPEADKQAQLRDCEQHLKRIFTLCLNDRAPLEESRKWGIYYIINLLFKTYFKLNSASLSRTILKTLAVYNQKGDMPPLESFPKSQRVTFKYYEGVLFFLEENYAEAEKYLVEAWDLCHKDAKTNSERILTYLIPCRLLTSHVLPTKKLLEPYPRLQELFLPLANCIRSGDLRNFDLALQRGEDRFVKRRIYLTLERGRDIALRNLLRKVFVAGGFEEPKEGETIRVRRTRIAAAEFQAAISMGSGGDSIDTDEVECLLANMIYKDLMKGYIARDRGIVVLSKRGAFPGTGL